MDEDFDGRVSIDYADAWRQDFPFLYLKTMMMQALIELGAGRNDYPYDQIFNFIVTRGLVKEAFAMDIPIEIRYRWELLDDENILMHSCSGMVAACDIVLKDDSHGFAIDGSLFDLDTLAISYRDVFWVARADSENPSRIIG